MPLNIKYTSNVSSPLYKTGSDVFLGTSIDDATEDEKTKSNKLNFSTSIKTNLSEYLTTLLSTKVNKTEQNNYKDYIEKN